MTALLDKKIEKYLESNPHLDESNHRVFTIRYDTIECYSRERIARSTGRFYNPKGKQIRRDKKILVAKMNEEEFNRYEKIVKIEFKFLIPQPKRFNLSERELANKGVLKPITRPDLDNYIKYYNDVLNETIMTDDSIIVEINSTKFYNLYENNKPETIIKLIGF